MQKTFCAPGGPAEVPASRGIVGPINRLTAELRSLGVPVIWVLHANSRIVYFCNLDIAHRDRTAWLGV